MTAVRATGESNIAIVPESLLHLSPFKGTLMRINSFKGIKRLGIRADKMKFKGYF